MTGNRPQPASSRTSKRSAWNTATAASGTRWTITWRRSLLDMKACYAASFRGMCEAKPYFERIGHPTHRMTRIAINGPLPKDIGTGFAEVQEWEFAPTCHPVVPAWFGRHFSEGGWALTPLLAFLVESGLLRSLKVREAIVSFEKQTSVWLPKKGIWPAPSAANSPRAARQRGEG